MCTAGVEQDRETLAYCFITIIGKSDNTVIYKHKTKWT